MSRTASGKPPAAGDGAPPEVIEFLAAKRTPRARATAKIEDVAKRLIAGQPPLDRARDLWVHGSYARGALDVGDVDLILELDEPRAREQQVLDAFYARGHPYADFVKALGCGGGSFVNVDTVPVFAPAPIPISSDRAGKRPAKGFALPVQPVFRHDVTGDVFEPQPQLLWVRGDGIEDVRRRLQALPQDPQARRFERTTTVALMDTLLSTLGVQIGFLLAAQIRAGNLAASATVLDEVDPPRACERQLFYRYPPTSPRYAAAAAALAYLADDGMDLRRVVLGFDPVTTKQLKTRCAVSFKLWDLYLLGSSEAADGWRHLCVWPNARKGKRLALDLTVLDGASLGRLYQHIAFSDSGGSRFNRMREALGMPPLPASTPAPGPSTTRPRDHPGSTPTFERAQLRRRLAYRSYPG